MTQNSSKIQEFVYGRLHTRLKIWYNPCIIHQSTYTAKTAENHVLFKSLKLKSIPTLYIKNCTACTTPNFENEASAIQVNLVRMSYCWGQQTDIRMLPILYTLKWYKVIKITNNQSIKENILFSNKIRSLPWQSINGVARIRKCTLTFKRKLHYLQFLLY